MYVQRRRLICKEFGLLLSPVITHTMNHYMKPVKIKQLCGKINRVSLLITSVDGVTGNSLVPYLQAGVFQIFNLVIQNRFQYCIAWSNGDIYAQQTFTFWNLPASFLKNKKKTIF
jgi:hypothetical protein